MDYKEVIEDLQDIFDLAEFRIKNGDSRTFAYIPNDKLDDLKIAISAMQELQQYKQLGNMEEVRNAVEKQKAKKPIYKHYENAGEQPYIKIACPNGCRIQLYPVTDKHLAHEHDYCPKCGQAIDWSEEE